MNYKAILFDMDGVLIDSEGLMVKTGLLALHDFGVDAKPEDFTEFVGKGDDRYVGGVAEKYGLRYDPVMKERLYDYFGQMVAEECNLPEGEKDLLLSLREKGYKMAVCSASDRRKVMYNVLALGLGGDFFDQVVTASDVARPKPAPDLYLKGAASLGMEPSDCLVVEDSPSGVLSAQAAGIKVALLTSTFSKEYLLEQVTPDFLLPALKDLPTIL